jgi:hypothetical protein
MHKIVLDVKNIIIICVGGGMIEVLNNNTDSRKAA